METILYGISSGCLIIVLGTLVIGISKFGKTIGPCVVIAGAIMLAYVISIFPLPYLREFETLISLSSWLCLVLTSMYFGFLFDELFYMAQQRFPSRKPSTILVDKLPPPNDR